MSIDLGNSDAMFCYANMFKDGEGIERNYSKAIKYYKMAADKGYSRALAKYNTILESLPIND
ncbi:hypothetical protein TRFO_41487 [Tritrichomonas foetus]|uniref:Sel1 repeat family protein n=1 Tax=Tritrichomonas foetus TaxID=1144522 RepID=A0A1J4L058_9EUKA|nr:hypothetical protein TRFO_41487 [Tritrichomonas foetus]|eukprot:OHT16887.1 hypothetical protein TRFO_41487 [Tritrichomonas foetus]